jgi:hypothetical protein
MVADHSALLPNPRCATIGWVDTKWLGRTKVHQIVLSGAEIGQGPTARTAHRRTTEALSALDFDGDGKDEVMERTSYLQSGLHYEFVTVYRLKGRRLRRALTQMIGFDNEDALDYIPEGMTRLRARTVRCRADATISPPGEDGRPTLVIQGEIELGAEARRAGVAGCIAGRVSLRMRDGKFHRLRTRREGGAPKPAHLAADATP